MTTTVISSAVPQAAGVRIAMPSTINILVATFAGLGLPRTLSLPTERDTPIATVYQSITDRLPATDDAFVLTTVSNKQLLRSSTDPIATLLSSTDDTILSLRISRRLCGGKGGFGSQLRAAGGRMNSRKNRDRQNQNGSNRNLDGRRLRTVDEAKKLAEYLALKPDMEKREKEERKKRWQAVIDASERREEEIKSGKVGSNQGRLNADYVESKELAEEKTREAVLKAMREGTLQLERTGSESSMEEAGDSDDDDVGEESSGSSDGADRSKDGQGGGRTFFGWDEDEADEDESDESDEEAAVQEVMPAYEGKGKSRAI